MTEIDNNLIFDLGAHYGEHTDYYIRGSFDEFARLFGHTDGWYDIHAKFGN
jgi:hypothetical protein